eukprot:4010261-Amphidinium_carterae.1
MSSVDFSSDLGGKATGPDPVDEGFVDEEDADAGQVQGPQDGGFVDEEDMAGDPARAHNDGGTWWHCAHHQVQEWLGPLSPESHPEQRPSKRPLSPEKVRLCF